VQDDRADWSTRLDVHHTSRMYSRMYTHSYPDIHPTSRMYTLLVSGCTRVLNTAVTTGIYRSTKYLFICNLESGIEYPIRTKYLYSCVY
jgi:hypothetical protein